MTDTELLDGLQRLLIAKVATLRTCRSGIKVEVSERDFWYCTCDEPSEVRSYYGGPQTDRMVGGEDIRYAIRSALEREEER